MIYDGEIGLIACFLQFFFRNRKVDEEAYILFVRKNALHILIPKYGLEGTIMLTEKDGSSIFRWNQEVSVIKIDVLYLNVIK